MSDYLALEDIVKAGQALKNVVRHTPLEYNDILSERYDCQVYLKREDLQIVRSFKIRGAYNKTVSYTHLDVYKRQRWLCCKSTGYLWCK